MIGESIQCENEGCDVVFVKKTHNQKYHDDECCRLATNAKIMQKYYDRKSQRLGLPRACKECGKALSKYNSSKTCNACLLKHEEESRKSVANMLSSILIA